MQLQMNEDKYLQRIYRIARVVYASTGATSLKGVQAFAGMIKNRSIKLNIEIDDLIQDKDFFECINPESKNHHLIKVNATNPAFLMCVRVVGRMIKDSCPDICCGATRFHYSNEMPEWAKSLGYIYEVDNLLFYK